MDSHTSVGAAAGIEHLSIRLESDSLVPEQTLGLDGTFSGSTEIEETRRTKLKKADQGTMDGRIFGHLNHNLPLSYP